MKTFAAILLSTSALLALDTAKVSIKPATVIPSGTFTLRQSPDVPKGIEQATEGVPFLLRGMAEKRLTDVNPAYHKVVLSQDAASVTIQFDGRQPVRVPLKGGAAWTREDGETFWVSASTAPSKLTQTYKAKDGERTNEFTLSPDGKFMVLKVSVRSPKLSKVLNYSMVYAAAK